MAKKKPAVNPFDAFATAKPAAKKSASAKIAADMTPEVQTAVDLVIKNKAAIKALKAELEQAELEIIEHVYPQQEKHARDGNYCKSFTVTGTNGAVATVTTGDKWSVPKDTGVWDALKKLLAKQFDKFMHMVRTVSLTEKAMNDTKLINDFVAVAVEHGYEVTEAFTIVDQLACQKGMDETQFTLPKAKLAEFRSLVKQYKATIK